MCTLTARPLYTGCTLLESLFELLELPCSVTDNGGDAELGKIAMNTIQGLVFLGGDGSETYLLVSPESGVFAQLVFEGSECPLSGEYTLVGSLVFRVTVGEATEVLSKSITDNKLFPADRIPWGTTRTMTVTGSARKMGGLLGVILIKQ